MQVKNVEMEQMLSTLEPYLERTDMIGYAAARNTRILRNESVEYFNRREQLILKYGEAKLDADGNETGEIELSFASPNFVEYTQEINEWANIEHEVDVFKIKYTEAVGNLSGNEILALDWMFED